MNIGNFTHSLSKGGAEKVAANISKIFCKNHQVKTFIEIDAHVDFDFCGELYYLNLKSKVKFRIIKFEKIRKIYNFIANVLEFRRIKKKHNLDVCISHSSYMNLMNLLSKRSKRNIIVIHNYSHKASNKNKFKTYFSRFFLGIMYKKADLIVAVSQGIKTSLIDAFNIDSRNIKVIYNPVDYGEIQYLSEEKLSSKYHKLFDDYSIINVGGLRKVKGQANLIRAFAYVLNIYPKTNLFILGGGPEENRIRKLISELGITKNVFLLGFQKNPYKFIKKSKLFVLSSFHEGFPLSIIETMILSTPIIATNCEGPIEILAPNNKDLVSIEGIVNLDNGTFVPIGMSLNYNAKDSLSKEEELLSLAMLMHISGEINSKLMVNSARERAKDFDINKISIRWLSVLD